MMDIASVLAPRGAPTVSSGRSAIAWLGVMVTVLTLLGGIGLGSLLGLVREGAAWNTGVRGRLTVQIMPEGLEAPPQEVPAAMAVLRSYPGIVSASLMSKSDNLALVAPWLGDTAAAADLPFPALIDVRLGPGRVPDIPDLQKRLRVSAPHAVIDDHRQLANPWAVTSPTVLAPLLLLAGSVCALLFVWLAFIRARLATQWQHLELFQLLGASDWRIAKLFAVAPLLAMAAGSIAGTAVAAGLFGVRAAWVTGTSFFIPAVAPVDIVWLAFIPAATTIIGFATACLPVLSALRRG